MGASALGDIQTSWSVLKRKDIRRYRRFMVDAGILQVAWLDLTGNMRMTRTRALDISEGGISLELPEAAMRMSVLRFQSSRFNLRGAGTVRHCRRVGTKYVVGVEFTEGLRWRAPQGEVREPVPLGVSGTA
jgi:hypothetical protein